MENKEQVVASKYSDSIASKPFYIFSYFKFEPENSQTDTFFLLLVQSVSYQLWTLSRIVYFIRRQLVKPMEFAETNLSYLDIQQAYVKVYLLCLTLIKKIPYF